MSKKKQITDPEPQTITLIGWSENAIQPVIDSFEKMTGIAGFPQTFVQCRIIEQKDGRGGPMVSINDHNYSLAYFLFQRP